MKTLAQVTNLKKHFEIKSGLCGTISSYIKAVDDVSFTINHGETLGLIGESGSGKSTMARLFLRLISPTAGEVRINGVDVAKADSRTMKSLRRQMGIVFQDPAGSMNPRATIKWSLQRPLLVNGIERSKTDTHISDILEKVNLGAEILERYPHQLSGGQQQRVSVARALILRPQLLILDEPTSALDISVQAQILNVLLDIQKESNLAYLFISHDLNVIRYISDRVAIMYLGKLMEIGPALAVLDNALHPYTRTLAASSPPMSPHQRQRDRLLLTGEPASLINLPRGCRLSQRCPYIKEVCKEKIPELREIENEHWVACHRAEDIWS